MRKLLGRKFQAGFFGLATLLTTLAARADLPVIATEPATNVTVNNGDTATFTVAATGTGLTYKWKVNGITVVGATTATLTLTGVSDTQGGSNNPYVVVVSNGSGSVTSAPPSFLTVLDPPLITTQPTNMVVTEGNEAVFNVDANRLGANFGFQWLSNNIPLTGETTSGLDIDPVTIADAATYSVIITNTDGSVTSSNALLTVVEQNLTTSQSIAVPINTCTNLTFTVVTHGTDTSLIYQWFKDGNPVGSNSTNFTISDVQLADAGTYSVTVRNSLGSEDSTEATITVTDPPPVVLTKNITINLDATGNASLTADQVNNGSYDNCAIATMSVSPNSFACANVGPNTVTLTVTDNSNHVSTNTAIVTVMDITPPTVAFHVISVQLDNTGKYTLTSTDMANIGAGSADACGISSYAVTPSSFSYCDVGSKPVTLVVSDTHGNSTTNTGLITVLTPTGPPSIVVVDTNYTGSCATVTFPFAGGTGSYYIGYNAFPTIQAGLNAVAVGGTVNVSAGRFNENLVINKWTILNGAGSGSDSAVNTVVASAAVNTPVIMISAGGSSATDRFVVSNLRVTGATGTSENSASGIELVAPGDHYTFSNLITVSNAGDGLAQNLGSGGNNDMIVLGCSFSNNSIAGFRVPTGGSIDGLTVTNSHFDGNQYGMEVYMGNGSGSVFQNVNVADSTFNNNSFKGTYFEKLNNASFSGLTVSNSGYLGANAVGFNINLKFNAYSNIQILNSDIIGCGTGDTNVGGGVVIEARGTGTDSSTYTVNPATLSGVTLSDLNVTGSLDGIRFGEPGKNNVGPTGVTILDCNLAGNTANGIHNQTLTITTAASNWWGSVSGPSGTANPYGTGSGVNGPVAFSPWLGDGTDTSSAVGFQPNTSPVFNPPTQLVFTTEPGNANLGDLLSSQPVVQVEDTNGNVTPWANPAVNNTLGNNLTGAVLAGTNPQLAVNGVATFTDLAVTVSGGSNFTLVASAPFLASATSTTFDIFNQAPAISSISPTFAVAGDPSFILTVNGTNFGAEYSTVRWNGSPLLTTYVSPTQITAVVPATDIASVGSASVTVFNVAPGGGESAPATLNILPVPTTVFVNSTYTSGGTDDGHLFGYDAFATVQGGITRVAATGTVNVAAGTYSESDTVTKPLSLLGANQGVAGCATRAGESSINAGAGNALTIKASNVVVDGFALSGVEAVVDTNGFAGAVIQNNAITALAVGVDARNIVTTAGAGFTLRNNCVTMSAQTAAGAPTVGIGLNSITGAQAPLIQSNNVQNAFIGYLLYGLNAAAPTVVQGGSITGVMQGVDVYNINPLNPVTLSSSTFGVSGLTVSGFSGNYLSLPNNNFHAGVYVFTTGPLASALLTGVITNVSVTGSGKISSDSAGLYLSDFSTASGVRQQITVQNCDISTNENRGISVSGTNAVLTVTGSSVLGNGFDPFGTGGNYGFGIIARNNARATISNCFIVNPATVTSPYNVRAIEADANTTPTGPIIVVTDCSILNNGNPSGYLASQDAGTLNASGNWWGTTSDTTIASNVLGVVDFTPYLDSGVDTDLATLGFQGDFSVLHVTTLGSETGNPGRIQEGINTVSGGTVYIQAGTYVEGPQILINKDITMIGDATATTLIKPVSDTSNAGDAKGWWLVQPLMTFNLSKVTLDGTGKQVFDAIRSHGKTSVDQVHFTHIEYNPSGPDYSGIAIVGFDDTVNPAVLNISNSQLDNIGRIGIFYSGGLTTGTCSSNVYTGKGPGNWLDYGVEVGAGADVVVVGNTVTGNKGVASVDGSTSAGITADSFFAPGGTKAIMRGNTAIGNSYGIAIGFTDGDNTAVLIESNNLTLNDADGIQVVGGGTVDAGDCTSGHVTGLGSSAGGNNLSGYGFDNASPWAIENLNGSGPAVLAYQNSFGAVIGNNLAAVFSGNVLADQSGSLLVQYPAPLTLQCLSSVPTGANSLAGFVAQGGAVSATTTAVSFSDLVLSNTPNNRVITRTYTLTDTCSLVASGTQIITVADTNPPVVTSWPTNRTLNVGGQCQVMVPDLTLEVMGAADNCGTITITQNPLAGTFVSLGVTNVLVTVADQGGNSIFTNVMLNIVDTNPAPVATFVDTNYSALAAGTVVKFPFNTTGPDHYVGCDAFGTIQAGINRVAANGTVNVASGRYVEVLAINQPLTLLGPNATNNPNTGTRVAEAVIQPNTSNPEALDFGNPPTYYSANAVIMVTIGASQVTIKGFTIDGYNPDLSGAFVSGTNSFNAAMGIADLYGNNSIKIENNIVKNDAYAGIDLESDGPGSPPTTNNVIRGNLIANMDYNTEGYGLGITLYNNAYAEISCNYLTNVAIGISPQSYFLANPGDAKGQTIQSNNISASLLGIWLNLVYESASTFDISGNISTFAPTNGSALYNNSIPEWDGIELTSIQSAVGVSMSNNLVTGPGTDVGYDTVGYNVWNTPTTGAVVVQGGSVSNVTYGVWVNNYDGYLSPAFATQVTITGLNIAGASKAGIYVQDDPRAAESVLVQATVNGNTAIHSSAVGVLVQGTNAAATVVNNLASITGNGIGVLADLGKALLQSNDLSGNSLAGISVINGATVDAGNCTGANVTGLGISTGGNILTGYGFDNGSPWAITNGNPGGNPVVLADHDNFGAVVGDNISNDFSGAVQFTQSPVAIGAPSNVLVTCVSLVPAGATDLAGLVAQGGYYSGNHATVGFVDDTNIIGSGVIHRTYTVTDGCSLPSTIVQTITVSDTTPPTFVMIQTNVTYSADLGQCSKSNVTWVVTAQDECSAVSVVSTPTNGSTFLHGTTVVTTIATDTSGNKATNTFTVTVKDDQAPIVTTWPANATLDVNGQCQVAVPDLTTQIVATDNCDTPIYTQNPPVGTLVSLGATNVLVTVSDLSGNSVSSNVVLTVVDTQPAPVATFVDTNYSALAAGTVVKFPFNTTGPDHYVGCDAFGTIQAGINRVATNGTVNVAAGLYVENVEIDRALNLVGPNATNNPNTGSRVAEAIIEPAISDPDPFSTTAQIVVYVDVSGVSISGITVDGSNPALGATNAVLVGTNLVNASEGIVSYQGVGSISISNNIVRDTAYSGVDFDNYNNGGVATTSNEICGNLFTNIGYPNYGFGIAVLIYDNFYVEVTSNTMAQVRLGVQTGNYYQANPGDAAYQSIHDNTISAARVGIFHNLQYANASSFVLSNNTITASSEAGSLTLDREWSGIVLASVQGNVGVTAVDNTITANPAQVTISGVNNGYNVWNTPTTNTVLIQGGSVSNATYGVWVNNYDGYNSAAGATQATITGLKISGASSAGIYVQNDPRASTNALVQAVVNGNTEVHSSTLGVFVQGPNAAASVMNNLASITGNNVGVQVDAGKALLQANDLSGNSLAGIIATNGAIVDAGNCPGANVTGLGISTGGNILTGYTGSPWAIINGNIGGSPIVLADHDNFGAVVGDDISADFSGAVQFTQSPAAIGAPTNVFVTCVTLVPAGATDLAGLVAQGGYYSGNHATVGFVDDTNIIGSGVIHRTYTVTDGCSLPSTIVQTITVSDTTPPTFVMIQTNLTLPVDPGQTNRANVTWVITATDECSSNAVSVVSIPPSGSTFATGITTVTTIATDTSSNQTTNTFTVQIVGLPQITQQPISRTNNATTTATFTVVATSSTLLTYQWMKNGVNLTDIGNITGSTNSTLSIANVQDVDVADYSVAVSNIAGTVPSGSAHLTVIDPPLITIQPVGLTNNATSNVSFTVVVSGTSPFGYQWLKDGTNVLVDGGKISGSLSNTLTISNILAADRGLYSVIVTNPANTVTSSNAALGVNDPWISIPPVSTTQPLSGSASFSVVGIGTAPLTYAWQQNGIPIPTATNSTYSIGVIRDSDSGIYTVIVASVGGSVTSAPVTLTVTHPPVFATQPISVTVNVGQNASFNVTMNGTSPFTYQWQKNLVNISGANAHILTLNSVTTADAGSYDVVVTNVDGTATSRTVTLTVIVPPAITTQPLSLTNNAGTPASFTVSATGTTLAYQWFKNTTNRLVDGGNISGSTNATLNLASVFGADAGTYSVVITNLGGTLISSNATLTVIDPVITNEPVSISVILGNPATFTVGAVGTTPTYQWRYNGTPIGGATNSAFTLASVTDANGGNYDVIVTTGFGSVTSAPPAALIVLDPPVITVQPASRTNNAGTTATFGVTATGTAPLSYQWKRNSANLTDGGNINGSSSATLTILGVSDSDIAAYSVVIINVAGTNTSSDATLTVIDPPLITSEPTSLTNDAGTTAIFTVAVNGTAPLVYQWRKGAANLVDGGNISGSSSHTLTITGVTDADAAGYSVVVTNAAGTQTSTTATLTVIDAPFITHQPVSITNNAGTTATFTVGVTGTAPLVYQWKKAGGNLVDGGNINGSSSATLSISGVADADAANYSVVITNAAGMQTSTTVSLTVIDPPVVTTQPVDTTNNAGTTATFSVVASGTTPLFYQWYKNGTNLTDIGNITGSASNILTLSNVFGVDRGVYSVTITNAAGMATSSNAALSVIDPVITLQPTNTKAIDGNTVSFSVAAVGTPTLSYHWRVDGVDLTDGFGIGGSQTPTLTITNVADSDAGAYSVVITNLQGQAISVDAVLTTVPTLIVFQPTNLFVKLGDPFSLSVGVNGTLPFSYQWVKDTTNINTATNRIYSVASSIMADSGIYQVVVSNPDGTELSASATVVVYSNPIPVISIVSYNNNTAVVNLKGVPTFNYQLQASTNLVNWVPVETNASPFDFTDTNSLPQRFYRGLYLP